MLKKHIMVFTVLAAGVLCLLVRSSYGCSFVLGICCVILVAEGYIEQGRMRRKLLSLTDYITTVQDDLSLPELYDTEEGELGILQSEVYKMVALLREKYSIEKKQKVYMSDMLSDISHQIKTPLTAIQLMTELLEQPVVEDEKRLVYAEKIDIQVTRITWLIRNLLTLSQLEAGVLTMKREVLKLSELMQQLHESIDIIAEIKGVLVNLQVPENMIIQGDSHWLREALLNIVKNSVEHTGEGGSVKVYAERNTIYTKITIEDNGSGIAEKDLPHIFERFYKAENASSQSVGIGLALAKQIISAHNGTIEVESMHGKGTIFQVKLYHT